MIKAIFVFIKDILDKRYMIYEMSKRDFKTMYTGSILGFSWSFIHPLVMTFIFWFVFNKGFRVLPIENAPFIIWLLCGLVPWNFFNNSLSTNTNVLLEYSYLVKKTNFRLSILPIVKLLSAFFAHIIFILILIILLLFYSIPISIYWLQSIYYTFALMFFLLGLSWITSSITVFLKDVVQIVGIFLQIGFWMTPIFWNYNILPSNYLILCELNPLFYIIEGYRNSFIYKIPFWEKPLLSLYFWFISFILIIIGILIYKRLRPHFADVI